MFKNLNSFVDVRQYLEKINIVNKKQEMKDKNIDYKAFLKEEDKDDE